MEVAKTRSEVITKDSDVNFKRRSSIFVFSEPRASFAEESWSNRKSCLGCRVSRLSGLKEDHLASAGEAERRWKSRLRKWLMVLRPRSPDLLGERREECEKCPPEEAFSWSWWENGKQACLAACFFEINISKRICRWFPLICLCIIRWPQPICMSHVLRCGGKWFVYRMQRSERTGRLTGSVACWETHTSWLPAEPVWNNSLDAKFG